MAEGQCANPLDNATPDHDLLVVLRCSEKTSSALFFKYNQALGPPYHVLIDTNFINFSIKNKVRWRQGCCLDLFRTHFVRADLCS